MNIDEVDIARGRVIRHVPRGHADAELRSIPIYSESGVLPGEPIRVSTDCGATDSVVGNGIVERLSIWSSAETACWAEPRDRQRGVGDERARNAVACIGVDVSCCVDLTNPFVAKIGDIDVARGVGRDPGGV